MRISSIDKEKHQRCFSLRRTPPETLDAAGLSGSADHNILTRIHVLWEKYPAECLAAFLVLIFRFIWYKNVEIARLFPDSGSYINYAFQMQPNFRTPVYPCIIAVIRILLGEHYLVGVVIFQIFVGLISVVFLYKLLLLATKNRYLSLFITTIYGASPTIIQWDTHILTESLSISGMVFFLYLMVRYIDKPSVFYGTGAVLAAFVLTMHRPSCLLMNYALLAFWLLRLSHKDERPVIKRVLPLSILAVVLILLYSYSVFLEFGDFALTPLTPRHLLAACFRGGVYQSHPNTELVQTIEQIYMEHDRSIAYDTTTPVMLLIADCATAITSDNTRAINMSVLEFCQECIRRNPKQYVASILQMMLNYLNFPLCVSAGDMAYEHARWVTCISWQTLLCTFLKIGHLYLLCFVEGITTLRLYIRSKRLDWMHLGLTVF